LYLYSALCSKNRTITAIPTVTAVLFQPEDYPLQHLALRYALQYINMDPELLPGTELYKEELNVSQGDSSSTAERGREC
jgi:hypothetical protein